MLALSKLNPTDYLKTKAFEQVTQTKHVIITRKANVLT